MALRMLVALVGMSTLIGVTARRVTGRHQHQGHAIVQLGEKANATQNFQNSQLVTSQKASEQTSTFAYPAQCISGVHVWVEHKYSCQYHPDPEAIGCNLPNYASASSYFGRILGKQSHWFGGEPDQEHIWHTPDEVDSWQADKCSEAYHMPDFCSRAIVSELSTAYNGVNVKTSLAAGAKHLLDTMEEKCDSQTYVSKSKRQMYEHILDLDGQRKRACWGFGQEWRKLFCIKYSQCTCDHNLPKADENSCSSDSKIQCCRNQYQHFLDDFSRDKVDTLRNHRMFQPRIEGAWYTHFDVKVKHFGKRMGSNTNDYHLRLITGHGGDETSECAIHGKNCVVVLEYLKVHRLKKSYNLCDPKSSIGGYHFLKVSEDTFQIDADKYMMIGPIRLDPSRNARTESTGLVEAVEQEMYAASYSCLVHKGIAPGRAKRSGAVIEVS